MRVLTRSMPVTILLAATAAAAAAIAIPGTASAAGASPVVGHVYVNDNTAGTNTIGVFDRHADGALTPHPGSPFAAGGAGTGTGLASQGALQISPDGRFLLAVDAGSNQVSVLRIKPGGSVKLVPGAVVPSGGVLPVSVTIHRDLVYVANSGTGGSNYTGFRLGRSGHLHPLAGSTVVLPDGAQPGDVLFNTTGSKLAGTRVGTSQIDSFTVHAGGLLTAAPGSPVPAQGLGPFGSEFRPTNPRQLFVSNAHNTGTGTVSAFRDSANGTLTSIGSSPFPDHQTAPCWVEITRGGRFLFTVNTASGSVSGYSIAPGGALKLLGSTPIRGTGVGAVDARLSPGGRYLYVDESAAGAVAAFAVHGGSLTELASSPAALPAGATPAGLVAT
jgi:6-phosphogluconolactonase (cycloisomerase 2 family)